MISKGIVFLQKKAYDSLVSPSEKVVLPILAQDDVDEKTEKSINENAQLCKMKLRKGKQENLRSMNARSPVSVQFSTGSSTCF
jgi:hypothetical protein